LGVSGQLKSIGKHKILEIGYEKGELCKKWVEGSIIVIALALKFLVLLIF